MDWWIEELSECALGAYMDKATWGGGSSSDGEGTSIDWASHSEFEVGWVQPVMLPSAAPPEQEPP